MLQQQLMLEQLDDQKFAQMKSARNVHKLHCTESGAFLSNDHVMLYYMLRDAALFDRIVFSEIKNIHE